MHKIMRTLKTHAAAIALGLTVSGLAPARGALEPRSPEPNTPPTTDVSRQKHDTATGSLDSPPGSESEQAYLESARTRAAELLDRASRESDELMAASLRLAAANLMLAEPLVAPCTMRLMRCLGLTDPADPRNASDVLNRARDLLDQIGGQIEEKMKHVEGMEASTADSWATLRSNQRSLKAFLKALHVLLLPDDHEDVARAMRRAASGLAPLLERTEPDIVAAAALWYATLRADEKNKDAALSVLSPALQSRPSAGIHFAFYARLLRCRLIADRSSPPTALALLLQLEDMLEDWFDDDATRDQASRSLLLVRAHILDVWKQRLERDAPPEERQFLDQRIEGIHARLAETPTAFLKLGHAIPLLAQAPE